MLFWRELFSPGSHGLQIFYSSVGLGLGRSRNLQASGRSADLLLARGNSFLVSRPIVVAVMWAIYAIRICLRFDA